MGMYTLRVGEKLLEALLGADRDDVRRVLGEWLGVEHEKAKLGRPKGDKSELVTKPEPALKKVEPALKKAEPALKKAEPALKKVEPALKKAELAKEVETHPTIKAELVNIDESRDTVLSLAEKIEESRLRIAREQAAKREKQKAKAAAKEPEPAVESREELPGEEGGEF